MKRFNAMSSTMVAACLLALGLIPGQASAAVQTRVFSGNANAWCNSATPASDGFIRKRPLAVQNEGTSDAFVTCTFISQYPTVSYAGSAVTQVKIWAQSFDGAAHTINCTGVSGYPGFAQYIVKSINVDASGAQFVANWNAADFMNAPAVFPSNLFSLSCHLPPGAALNDMYVSFTDDVGN